MTLLSLRSADRHDEAADIRRRVLKDPQRYAYTDQALAAVAAEETETLELFSHNAAARDEVKRTRRIAQLTHGGTAAVQEPVSA